MLYATLNSGDTLPKLGLGTWKSDAAEIESALAHAIKVGYRHIDCAPIYMNEKPIGKALSTALQAGITKRDQLWITSKLWNSFHDPDHVTRALKDTLHFMQLDYLDLFLMHWPVALHNRLGYQRARRGNDFISLDDIPLHETWLAMADCQRQGLTRNIGVSNFSINKLQNIIQHSNIIPAVNQVECHPYLAQTELIDHCRQLGIHVTAYAPLGSGDRPSFLKATQEPSLLDNPIINKISQQLQCSAGQLLLAWSLQHVDSVIPKSTNHSRIEENLASQEIELASEHITAINSLNLDYRFIKGDFFVMPGSPYTKDSIWD